SAGQLEGDEESYAQLRSPLGSANLPRSHSGSREDGLRSLFEQSAFSIRWDDSQSEKDVSAAPGLCLGRRRKREVCPAWHLGNLQRSSEHVDAGRRDHDEWHPAT